MPPLVRTRAYVTIYPSRIIFIFFQISLTNLTNLTNLKTIIDLPITNLTLPPMADQITDLAQVQSQLDFWQTNPIDFMYEAYQLDRLYAHQIDFFKKLGEFVYVNSYQAKQEDLSSMLLSSRRDKLLHKIEQLSQELDGITLSEEEQYYVRKAGFMISSGRDLGKTATMAMVAGWFLVCFENPQGYIIAPTGAQAKTNVMAEIALWFNRKIEDPETGVYQPAFIFRDLFDITSEAVRFKAAPLERFIVIKRIQENASIEDQKTVLSGAHSKCQLFFLDEAIFLKDHAFETINATNGEPLNFLIGAFNPLLASSYAVRAVFGDKANIYVPLRWNAEDSDKPGIDQIIASRIEEYGGVTNDAYRVNVQGLPPEEGDDVFLPISWFESAKNRTPLYPKSDNYYIGHDVAGEGSDDACTIVVRGTSVEAIYLHQNKDDNEQAVFLDDLYQSLSQDGYVRYINVDTIGIGLAVYRSLSRMLPEGVVKRIIVSRKATRTPDKFYNQRTQMYWQLRQLFKDDAISFNLKKGSGFMNRLMGELSATDYDVDYKQQIKIIAKAKIKEKLGGRSPDVSDALCLAFFGKSYDEEQRRLDTLRDTKEDYWDTLERRNKNKNQPGHWMAV